MIIEKTGLIWIRLWYVRTPSHPQSRLFQSRIYFGNNDLLSLSYSWKIRHFQSTSMVTSLKSSSYRVSLQLQSFPTPDIGGLTKSTLHCRAHISCHEIQTSLLLLHRWIAPTRPEVAPFLHGFASAQRGIGSIMMLGHTTYSYLGNRLKVAHTERMIAVSLHIDHLGD